MAALLVVWLAAAGAFHHHEVHHRAALAAVHAPQPNVGAPVPPDDVCALCEWKRHTPPAPPPAIVELASRPHTISIGLYYAQAPPTAPEAFRFSRAPPQAA